MPNKPRKVRVPPVKKTYPEKSKGGRNPFEPTAQQRAMVRELSIGGYKQQEICKAIRNPQTNKPIDKVTLELHFRDELDIAYYERAALTISDFMRKCTGASAVIDQKTGKVIRKEVLSDTRAQIFFLETRLKDQGWSRRTEHTGKGGLPLDFGQLSDTQLDAVIDRLEARHAAAGTPEG